MPPEDAIFRKAARAVGKKAVKLAIKRAGSRLLGKLATSSRAWKNAFTHIARHFKPMADKASHAIFEKKFRSFEALMDLIEPL